MSETNYEENPEDGIELPELEVSAEISGNDKMTMEEADKALKAFTSPDSGFGTEENLNNIIRNLTRTEDLETLTDLDSKEIVAITRLIWFATQYNAPSGLLLAKKLLQTKVSKGRGGRTELVQSIIGAFRMEIEKAKEKKIEV